MLNQTTIQGRICRDLELRSTNTGVSVCSFSVAVDRDYAKNGNRETDFFDVVAYRQTAEFVSKRFIKGQQIVIRGQMQSRKWTDKNGSNRISWELIADAVYFCGDSKNDNQKPAGKPVGVEFEEIEDEDPDSLPF